MKLKLKKALESILRWEDFPDEEGDDPVFNGASAMRIEVAYAGSASFSSRKASSISFVRLSGAKSSGQHASSPLRKII
jgi:hypothetical protein